MIKTTIIVIFSTISDKFFLSRLPHWLFPKRIDTKYWKRGLTGNQVNRSMIFSIHLTPKMLLGKIKKEYFAWKVKCIYCIYVLICVNWDEEWQVSYENPSQPSRYHHNDAGKYWCFFLSCFLSVSKQWRKVARIMQKYCKPFH